MYTKIIGSKDLEVSKAGENICLVQPEGYTYPLTFKKFQFINETDCHVRVNGADTIFLTGGNGLELDMKVESFVILETGVKYTWIGGY